MQDPAPLRSTRDSATWRKEIETSIAKRRRYETWWEANLKAYAPGVDQSPDQYGADINTNRDFTIVERKKADLFFQKPDVTLSPSPLLEIDLPGPVDLQTGQPSQVSQAPMLQSHQAIVNEELGPDGVDATRLVHQTLFDVICTQGVGFTKMGYESFTVEVERPDPKWTPPDALDAAMSPEQIKKALTPPIIKVPVPVHERCFWEHFSGKRAVIPHDFRSTEWDTAPYLGYQFTLPLTPGNREKYRLPEDFSGQRGDEKQHYEHGGGDEGGASVFTGVEVWYRSALFREDVVHPEHLTQIVFVDGIDEPVLHQDSPYQTVGPDGSLTPDSLIGFPIHPLNVRTLTDSAYVASDCTMVRPLINELNIYREQQVQFRDAATLKFMANGDVLPREALDKIVRAPVGGIVVVPGEAFHGEGAIKELPQGSMPRETFAGQQAIDDDIARSVTIDGSAAGVQAGPSQTATAEQRQQANANARLDFERNVVLQWYCKGVTKYSTLIQRYLPVKRAAQIVGPQAAQQWDQWRKQVPSSLMFTAMPDSALRVDQAVDRQSSQQLYQFLANDPYIQKGRGKLLEKLLRKYHIDPTGIVAPPDPPKPEPPKIALSFKGEDLVGPQGPIVIEILQQQGIQISPEAAQLALAMAQASAQMAAQSAGAEGGKGPAGDPRHGGALAGQEPLSKHAADKTGAMQNTGMPAGMGAAGGRVQ
jgi:hypothetical protein